MKIFIDKGFDQTRINKVYERLKEIAGEKNVRIVTLREHDDFLEYCRNDVNHTLLFFEEYNRLDHLRRIEERRRKRHVSRRKRDLQPKRRKRYLGKRRLPTEKTVQLLERNFLSFVVHKNRTGCEGMGIRIDPSQGYGFRPIQAVHDS